MSKKAPPEKPPKATESCPHCGSRLSPWEQVLLSVDRALTCRHCWYRILIDTAGGTSTTPDSKEQL